eukprot:Selendium_serpulae@DN5933_c1_g1_i6.p1
MTERRRQRSYHPLMLLLGCRCPAKKKSSTVSTVRIAPNCVAVLRTAALSISYRLLWCDASEMKTKPSGGRFSIGLRGDEEQYHDLDPHCIFIFNLVTRGKAFSTARSAIRELSDDVEIEQRC